MKASVAGAPVSFGVFELTPEGQETIAPDDMLATLADSGYSGIDLGPLGYLGSASQLRARLESFGLDLAGGWVQLPFSESEAFEAALPELHAALAVFSDAAAAGPARLPLPTLADSGSAARSAAPGRGAAISTLDDAAWGRLAANIERAATIVRRAGFEPTFHHHAGTFVESPAEIDRFLANVEVDLTLDTGHLVIAGGDPVDAVQRWGDRINHLHLKDVDVTALKRVLAAGGGMAQVWASGAFVAFGQGDVDLDAILTALESQGYEGWIVVEQDVLNGPGLALDTFRAERQRDQLTNRHALRPWA